MVSLQRTGVSKSSSGCDAVSGLLTEQQALMRNISSFETDKNRAKTLAKKCIKLPFLLVKVCRMKYFWFESSSSFFPTSFKNVVNIEIFFCLGGGCFVFKKYI